MLADRAASGVEFLVGMLVHLFSADESFIRFDDAAELVEVAAASFAQPTEDELRGLLRDADFLGKLKRRYSLPRSHDKVHAIQPFVQRNMGAFEDGLRADGEFFFAVAAAVVPYALAFAG